MRDEYRALANRLGTDDALTLAHDLEHWHDAMEAHRESLTRLGFPPDGHPEWEGCPRVRDALLIRVGSGAPRKQHWPRRRSGPPEDRR